MKSLINSVLMIYIVTLIHSVKYAASIRCYVCGRDYDCGYDFDSMVTRECPSYINECIISKTTDISGRKKIVHDCGEHIYSFNGKGQSYHLTFCDTNLCNKDYDLAKNVHLPKYDVVASPFQCYVCSGDGEQKCGDDYDSSIARNCDAKVCSILFEEFNGKKEITRQCGPFNVSGLEMGEDHGKTSLSGRDVSWSTCYTNLCNSGVAHRYQQMALFLSVAFSVTFCYYY